MSGCGKSAFPTQVEAGHVVEVLPVVEVDPGGSVGERVGVARPQPTKLQDRRRHCRSIVFGIAVVVKAFGFLEKDFNSLHVLFRFEKQNVLNRRHRDSQHPDRSCWKSDCSGRCKGHKTCIQSQACVDLSSQPRRTRSLFFEKSGGCRPLEPKFHFLSAVPRAQSKLAFHQQSKNKRNLV